MAYTSITFENPDTGVTRKAPVGFSWTTAFFGFFPALFRRDWKWAIIIFILLLMTLGFAGLVFMFIYNKLYIKDLIKAGFKAKSVASGDMDSVASKMKIEIPRLHEM